MKIRKATKKDAEEILKLVKISNNEYSKLIGKNTIFTNNEIKKDFNKTLKSHNKFLLVAEETKNIFGYLFGELSSYKNNKTGNIDFLFILRNYRKKGIALDLVQEFIKILKSKNVDKIRLKVNIKNQDAFNFYKKFGFKITNYEMEKKLK
jgi:ribosomal protein S18 acetylase RimI-like enzyme